MQTHQSPRHCGGGVGEDQKGSGVCLWNSFCGSLANREDGGEMIDEKAFDSVCYERDEAYEKVQALEAERDLWKSKAEKLAEALKNARRHFLFKGSHSHDKFDLTMYDEALAEFEKDDIQRTEFVKGELEEHE